MKARSVGKLVVSIVACELLGNIGSLFTFPAIGSWYAQLNKPSFTPPNWLFGPAWTMFFFLMGCSLYLVWEKRKEKKQANKALGIFALQFALNILWSVFFFGLKAPLLAFIEIIVLWLAILATIMLFGKVSKKAALLLVPYLAWVSFAAVLNFFVWRLN